METKTILLGPDDPLWIAPVEIEDLYELIADPHRWCQAVHHVLIEDYTVVVQGLHRPVGNKPYLVQGIDGTGVLVIRASQAVENERPNFNPRREEMELVLEAMDDQKSEYRAYGQLPLGTDPIMITNIMLNAAHHQDVLFNDLSDSRGGLTAIEKRVTINHRQGPSRLYPSPRVIFTGSSRGVIDVLYQSHIASSRNIVPAALALFGNAKRVGNELHIEVDSLLIKAYR